MTIRLKEKTATVVTLVILIYTGITTQEHISRLSLICSDQIFVLELNSAVVIDLLQINTTSLKALTSLAITDYLMTKPF